MNYMLRLTLLAAAIGKVVSQSIDQWAPAAPGEARGPCPMLNTLANHGFLPRGGQNITLNDTTTALDTALNIPPEFGALLHKTAVRTNPDGNVTNTFSLPDLGRHNILEHDASLSRQDAFFGDNLAFNATVFAETQAKWQDTIDVPQAAAARFARLQTSNRTNPMSGLNRVGQAFSLGESAAYIIVLGNATAQTAPKKVVEYMFQNERLPTEVGWTRSAAPLGADSLSTVTKAIVNATAALMATSPEAVRRMLAPDVHAFA